MWREGTATEFGMHWEQDADWLHWTRTCDCEVGSRFRSTNLRKAVLDLGPSIPLRRSGHRRYTFPRHSIPPVRLSSSVSIQAACEVYLGRRTYEMFSEQRTDGHLRRQAARECDISRLIDSCDCMSVVTVLCLAPADVPLDERTNGGIACLWRVELIAGDIAFLNAL